MLGTAWVTDETENSLDVEWENPPTEVDYYKLLYSPLTGQEVAEVTVPKSSHPKSRYDITGKSQHWDGRCLLGMLRQGQRVHSGSWGLRNHLNPDPGNSQK